MQPPTRPEAKGTYQKEQKFPFTSNCCQHWEDQKSTQVMGREAPSTPNTYTSSLFSPSLTTEQSAEKQLDQWIPARSPIPMERLQQEALPALEDEVFSGHAFSEKGKKTPRYEEGKITRYTP